MKKFLSIFLIICLCLPFLTSCSNKPKNATELWEKINETMEGLKSYEASGTGTLSFKQGLATNVSVELKMKNIISRGNKNNFYYYSDSEITEKSDFLITPENTLKNTEAFYNGNMFISKEINGESQQKLYSSLSSKEYIAYLEKRNDLYGDIDFTNCSESAFAQNEDNTWSLNYSGYSNKVLNRFMNSFGIDQESFGFDIWDMKVSIQADNQFKIQEMTVSFVFSEDDTAQQPFFEIKTQYSNYNKAQPITDSLNPDSYKKIEDCRLLFDFENMLKKLEDAENGSFVAQTEETVSIIKKTLSCSATDTVSYGKKDGKYFYDIVSESSAYDKMNISYENGIQTIKMSGEEITQKQSKSQAKSDIRLMINAFNYSAGCVSDIKKLDEGVYEIQCNLDPDFYYQTAVNEKYYLYNPEFYQETLKITVKDGNIVKMETDMLAKGNTSALNYNSTPIEIHLIATITFNS